MATTGNQTVLVFMEKKKGKAYSWMSGRPSTPRSAQRSSVSKPPYNNQNRLLAPIENTYKQDFALPVPAPFQPRAVIEIDPAGDLLLQVGQVVYGDVNDQRAAANPGDITHGQQKQRLSGIFLGKLNTVQPEKKMTEMPILPSKRKVTQESVTFRVCSRTLARSGRFFQMLINGPMAENCQRSKKLDVSDDGSSDLPLLLGSPLAGDKDEEKGAENQTGKQDNSGHQWVITLPEDPPRGMRVILDVAHGHFDCVRENICSDWPLLYEVGLLVDKYDLAHLLRPWGPTWRKMFRGVAVGPEAYRAVGGIRTVERQLWLSWHLGDGDFFRKLVGNLANHVVVDGDSGEVLVRLHNPNFSERILCSDILEVPGIREFIVSLRKDKIRAQLDQVRGILEPQSLGLKCSVSSARPAREAECQTRLHRTLIAALKTMKLWPVPDLAADVGEVDKKDGGEGPCQPHHQHHPGLQQEQEGGALTPGLTEENHHQQQQQQQPQPPQQQANWKKPRRKAKSPEEKQKEAAMEKLAKLTPHELRAELAGLGKTVKSYHVLCTKAVRNYYNYIFREQENKPQDIRQPLGMRRHLKAQASKTGLDDYRKIFMDSDSDY
ncbi:hypothetical protein BX600DRAFT_554628 [Xylariales sp. PMI_506]|nr:hypothetical protein BX600DRAFT_554628 [Xylariales sp. PMI_506]